MSKYFYEDTQQMRKRERDVRKGKRRVLAADEIKDAEGKFTAQLKLKEKEATLKEFAFKSGQGFQSNRTQAMGFGHSEASKAVWAEKKAPLPKVVKGESTKLQATLGDSKIKGVLPQWADINRVHVIAGAGTSTVLRAAESLAAKFGGTPLQWQKKVGTIITTNFDYEIHWEEYAGKQYRTKLVKVKKK
ncbi:MAG: phage minor capsid protein [Christensenellales bacterium]|jgi:hypothetical protein